MAAKSVAAPAPVSAFEALELANAVELILLLEKIQARVSKGRPA